MKTIYRSTKEHWLRGSHLGNHTGQNTPKQAAETQTTFAEYAHQWLDGRPELAVRTIELYSWLLDRYINPTFGSLALDAVTPASVRSWNGSQAKVHPTTAAKAYRLLSSIFRAAVEDELATRNPCQVRGAAIERAPERPIATMQEVKQLALEMPEDLRI